MKNFFNYFRDLLGIFVAFIIELVIHVDSSDKNISERIDIHKQQEMKNFLRRSINYFPFI